MGAAEDALISFSTPARGAIAPQSDHNIVLALPAQMQSPSANREQFYESLVDLFNPRDVGVSSKGFNWMRVAALLAPSNPVLQDGLDTLSLIQLGSVHRDQRLLNESTVQYGKALRGTSRSLRQGGLLDDTVLATVSILALCEFFDHIKDNASGWLGHIAGVDQILLARKPASLNSKLSNILFFTSRHASLARSLVIRKADPLDTEEWRAAIRRIPLGFASHWISLAIQIPSLLERLDNLDVTSDGLLPAVEALLSDSESLESEIKTWHTHWQRVVAPGGGTQFTVHSIVEFQPFSSLVQDRTMSTAYRFPEHKTSHLHCQYWCSMWHLRRTLQSLYGLREQALSRDVELAHITRDDPTTLELDALVLSICHCLPYFASPETGTQGQISMFLPLRIATMHFRSREMWDWLAWVEDVRANAFTRGLSQPDIVAEDVVVPELSPLRTLDASNSPENAIAGPA